MKKFFVSLGAIAFAFSLSATLDAGIIVTAETGTQYTTTGVSSFVTGGTPQAGLQVTVCYTTTTGEFTETLVWSPENAVKGGVVSSPDSRWSLFSDTSAVNGTFDDPAEGGGLVSNTDETWVFANDWGKLPDDVVSLKSITLNGMIDDSMDAIVFDRASSGSEILADTVASRGYDSVTVAGGAAQFGTAGSERGRTFWSDKFELSNQPDVTVTYRNQVGSFGDLFTEVEIFFDNGWNVNDGSSFDFGLDTDFASNLSQVPEPSSLLYCSALALAVLGRRRRRG